MADRQGETGTRQGPPREFSPDADGFGDRFAALVDALDDQAAFLLDAHGEICAWPDGAERLTGHAASAVLDEHVSTLYVTADRERGVPGDDLEAAATAGSTSIDGVRLRADDTRFWAAGTLVAFRDEDGDTGTVDGYGVFLRDATEERRDRDENRLLLSVSRSIAEAGSLEEGLEAALAEVCQWTDWVVGQAWVTDEDGNAVRFPASYSETPSFESFVEASTDYRFALGEGIPGRVLASGEPVWFPDVSTVSEAVYPRTGLAEAEGIRAGLGVPITTDDEVTVVLEFYMAEPRGEESRLVEVVSSVAAKLAGLVERKRAEDALERERELLEQILETTSSSVVVLDPDGAVVRANERAREDLAIGEMADGRRLFADVTLYDGDGEAVPPSKRPFAAVAESGTPVFDWRCQVEPGSVGRRWFSVNAVPLYDGESIEGVVVTADDVTQLTEQSRRLRRQRDELASELSEVFERIDDAFFSVDEAFRVTYLTDRAASILGDRDAVRGESVWALLPPDVERHAREAFPEALETQEPATFDVYDEALAAWVQVRAYPSETGLSVYLADVTDRKRRERELEEHRALTRAASDAIVTIDDESTIRSVNPAIEDVLGYRPDELVGEPLTVLMPENLAERHEEGFARYLESGERNLEWSYVELTGRHADGHDVPLGVSFSEAEYADRLYFTGIIRDISARKARERELERYETLVEESADVNAVLDPDGTFRHLTASVGHVLGYPPGELEGESAFDYIHPEDREHTWEAFTETAMRESARPVAEFRFRHADGSWRWLEARGRNMLDDPTIEGIVAYTRDVTDRKARERELEHSRQQLAALDELNGVVRRITEEAVEQSTRADVERVVCEQLAAADSYLFAWIGDVGHQTDAVRVRAAAGTDGYLEDIDITVDEDDPAGRGPTARAVRTGEIQVVQDVAADPDYEHWRERAADHGVGSSAAIPIRHEDTLYGVLNVYSARTDAFDEAEREVIGQLGEVVGHAINAIERRDALLGDEVVELEFRVPDLVAGGGDHGSGRISFERTIALGDEQFLQFGTATEDGVEALSALADAEPHLRDLTVLGDADGEVRFQLRLVEPPMLTAVASRGGRVSGAVLEAGDLRLTVEVPPNVEVRDVLAVLEDAYPGATLLAKRQTSRQEPTAEALRHAFDEALTDRQRTALELAYYAGYFEWPRESTGEEVAQAMDISAATFTQHLRSGQNKLARALFEEDDAAD